ncbi:MBL fold metallo-hydrolase RNA specificity domain-containing protein [Pelagibius sp.]|uniref:MBL fold metallo-hydrolase RNA specificity domain-containing protein n=1 Tax=Pelagibius sp. TaxID=1931238 RepID=UPI003BB222EA
MLLSFCGAAGTVTGSCYWLRTEHCQFLVDCGMFQGSKTLKALNYGAFPFDPAEIDFVLLTHAHIDHSGLIPKLVKQGFKGPIFATEGSFGLLSYMLPDSAYIQESEVERLNRRNAQRGRATVKPMYDGRDVEAALEAFSIVGYETWREVGEGVRARFWNAGHILGAASIEIEVATGQPSPRVCRLLFSGDIGPEHKLFHPDPEAPENFDYVCCEATYGGRKRTDATAEQRRETLAREVNAALERGGNLLIPAFAVERTQELLLDLSVLFDSGVLPKVPVFLDSPLAIKATKVFLKNAAYLEDTDNVPDLFRRPNIRFTESVEESKMIARFSGGAIIIAGSGMCDAGRIRHHLKQNLWRHDATVMLVGYQAPGTLGALLSRGVSTVKIQGEDLRVKAAIRQIDVYSGHADGDQLLDWLNARLPVKGAIFLTHGEEAGLAALRDGLEAAGVPSERIIIPQLDDVVDLLAGESRVRFRPVPHRLPAESLRGLDWHNDLAAFSINLRDKLDEAADDKARRVILRRVVRALEGKRKS